MKKILLYLIPFFLLISCASSRFESEFSPVYVTNTSKYAILPTTSMSGTVDSLQKMTANFGKDNSFDFDVYVISDSSQLSMTILNEFGTTMASLFYDGLSLDFDSVIFPKELKAEYIVADFQFCLYNVDDLKPALEKIGVNLEITSEPAGDEIAEVRTLSKKGKVISKITKTALSIKYENFLRGYSYILSEVGQ
ncbi:DUF3261 domain-containing protein [Treponema sp.]|uniref:DUF3261 domain-containing protein n=1 Tax=Treponema sp. TaxID=166 RepID=UPI0025D27133|nr:DUF3261 domain-containing protein [Treponema sp.]MBR4323070.1 DUF3261 domain-containing protein [Treponema sp.]